MGKRLFTRQGLGYVMSADEILGELGAARIRTKGGETYAEIRVTSALVGTRTSDGVLHQASLNLGSTTARKTLATVLRERSNAPEVYWADLLEDFCRRVLAAERQGEPLEVAGNRPQRLVPAWRLDPLLATEKPVILYGEGGVGKSTLATAIAVSVQTGVSLIEGWIPRKAPVLYLDWEADINDLDERVKAIAAGANIPYQVEVLYRRCYRPLADQVEEHAAAVAQHGVGLVIVDSLALAAGASGENADAADGAIRLFGAFRVLATTVLAVGHVSKADQADGGRTAKPYGSVFYTNLARSIFELRRSRDGEGVARVALYNTKTNLRPLPPVGLEELRDPEAGTIAYRRFEVADDPALAKRLSLFERARAALSRGDLDDEELAAELDVPENVVRATLSRAARNKPPMVERLPSSRKWRLIRHAS